MNIFLQKSTSIEPRTSPPKFQISFPSGQFSFILQSNRSGCFPVHGTSVSQVLRNARLVYGLVREFRHLEPRPGCREGFVVRRYLRIALRNWKTRDARETTLLFVFKNLFFGQNEFWLKKFNSFSAPKFTFGVHVLSGFCIDTAVVSKHLPCEEFVHDVFQPFPYDPAVWRDPRACSSVKEEDTTWTKKRKAVTNLWFWTWLSHSHTLLNIKYYKPLVCLLGCVCVGIIEVDFFFWKPR